MWNAFGRNLLVGSLSALGAFFVVEVFLEGFSKWVRGAAFIPVNLLISYILIRNAHIDQSK